jgi:type II secretory pathway pseudopilin PulG
MTVLLRGFFRRMKALAPIRHGQRPSEEGYILVAVIFMLAILIISLALAAPRVAKDIQRDRELETMQRGKQYIRGIQLYYRKFNAYPPNVDALVKTNEIRFLRKKYVDPTTGKDEWKPIHFGQNKAPTAMGFFGQPLAGSTLAGIGPSGGNGVSGASPAGGAFMGGGGAGGAGTGAIGGTDNTGGAAGIAGQTSATGTDAGGTSGTSSTFSTGGQTFGGLGIIGFSPNSPKASILVYKKKSHYNEWEFVYDPAIEKMAMSGMSGAGSGAVPAGGAGTSSTGLTGTSSVGGTNTFGGSNGGSSGGTGFGSSPTQPTAPQQ